MRGDDGPSDLLGPTEGPRSVKDDTDEEQDLLGKTRGPVPASPGSSADVPPGARAARLREGRVVLDRFRLTRPLGQGGMGAVWAAADEELGRDVALKFLVDNLASRPAAVERFKKEVLLARELSDPHIVRVHDFHRTAANVFLSMELIDGAPLSRFLAAARAGGELPSPAFAAQILGGTLAGLAAAHAEGVVHRDVKPANIMLAGVRLSTGMPGSPPPVKLVDFGIAQAARIVGLAVGAGTPAYAAPEIDQQKAPVDERADLFSVGVILYELLTLRRPKGSYQKVTAIRGDCPPEIDAIVEKALQPEPGRRFQSAHAFLQALDPARFPGDAAVWAIGRRSPTSAAGPISSPLGRRTVPTLELFRPGAGRRRSAAGIRAVDPVLGRLLDEVDEEGSDE